MKRYLLIAGLGLAACSDQAAPQNAEASAPPERVRFTEQRLIAADTYAVVFPADAGRAAVEAAARERCEGRQWCKVLGWTDQSSAASALPMTDREAEAQAFSLTINRASGMDEAVWSDPQPVG